MKVLRTMDILLEVAQLTLKFRENCVGKGHVIDQAVTSLFTMKMHQRSIHRTLYSNFHPKTISYSFVRFCTAPTKPTAAFGSFQGHRFEDEEGLKLIRRVHLRPFRKLSPRTAFGSRNTDELRQARWRKITPTRGHEDSSFTFGKDLVYKEILEFFFNWLPICDYDSRVEKSDYFHTWFLYLFFHSLSISLVLLLISIE